MKWVGLLLLGLMVHLANSIPLPQEDEYYYDDYYYDYNENPELEPMAEPEPEPEIAEADRVPFAMLPELIVSGESKASNKTVPEATEDVAPILAVSENSEAVMTETSPEHPEPILTKTAPVSRNCRDSPDAGFCRGYFPMFYFDSATSACRPFVYGGCGGTGNVYKTSRECYTSCYPAGLKGSRNAVKGDYLILHDGSGTSGYEFNFPGHNAALKVDENALTEFSMSKVYQLEFFFRTDSPHGLIAFLRQNWMPHELEGKRVQLYVYLQRGRLGITYIFGKKSETIVMKKGGLQGGNWHSALVKVDSMTGQLVMEVDGIQETFTLTSIRDDPTHYSDFYFQGLTSVWIGGVFKNRLDEEEVTAGIVNFHGCLKKVGLMSGETSEQMIRMKPLQSSEYHDVTEICGNNCNDRYRNLCIRGAHCVEHFDHSTCNCFNTNRDGRRCEESEIPVLTLSSDGYVVHRLYEWMDRVHSYVNLISFEFKTTFSNSILFYATAEHPERQYLAVTLTAAATLYIEANFGGGAVSTEVGDKLNSNNWHKLTLIHQHDTIQVYINSWLHETLTVPGEIRYLHLDPDVFFGSAPIVNRYCGLALDRGSREDLQCLQDLPRFYYNPSSATCLPFNYSGCAGNDNRFIDHDSCMDTCNTPGLRSFNSFTGCLRNVFINDVSVLYELHVGNKTTKFKGTSKEVPLSTSCKDSQMELLTFSTEKANVRLSNPNPDLFHLLVSFRPSQQRSVIASGYVHVMETPSEWELRHDDKYVTFYVHDNLVNLKPDTRISIGHWQDVDIKYNKGQLTMTVNHKVANMRPGTLHFSSNITLGLGLLEDYPGMMGCVRRLAIGGVPVDVRTLAGTSLAHRDVIYDNCQLLRPCERPGACEHGATCTETDDGVACDCSGTGYTGTKCFFSLYKRSCEQYRQIGYNTTGIYKIDVDGNGPLPPGFVKCQFNPLTLETLTVVENNMPENLLVRRPDLDDLKIDVHYRDFNDDMLKSLIAQSHVCYQEARYDCRRSPLAISTRTWFSSPSKPRIDSFSSEKPGMCRCREVNVCDEYGVACNCDVADGLPRSDVTIMKNPKLIPFTSMVFIQDRKSEAEDSEGRITLGPLKCKKEVTPGLTVSFSQPGGFLEVPAWREGNLFLSFKTTSEGRAVLAYQPAYHPSHATFRITLVGDREVEFMYRFHGINHRHTLATSRRLNTGSWQQVLIDIHDHQVRLVVNSEQKLIDIDKDAHLGVLDGSLFLGGIPPQHLAEEEKQEQQELETLVGCIRGLTLNDEVMDLTRYIRTAPGGVGDHCDPSCDPNPCKNGARCIEKWGSYECVCENPFAHSGEDCEHNINADAITLTNEDSRLRYFVNDTETLYENNMLNSSFLLNFRSHSHKGMILFAHDYLHNFLQLHLAAPNELVLLFNSGKNFETLRVVATDDVVFSDGQSVQIAVERTEFTTSMHVYTKGSFFNASVDAGLLLLLEEDYEQFPFGQSQPVSEMVYYPHSVTKPHPYFQIYLGSASDQQYDVRSSINGLVGCVRGLKFGSRLISLTELLAKSDFSVEGVKAKCNMACDLKPCLNGGRCSEDFQYFNNFHCDCSSTSYTGPVCNSEVAYTFSGGEWISRYATVSPIMEDVTMELAFSASKRQNHPQLVTLLRSTDEKKPFDYMLVCVLPDGAILVEAQLEDLDSYNVLGVRVTPGRKGVSAFNGLRHYIIIKWTEGELKIKVDGEARDVHTLRMIQPFPSVTTTPTGLYLGGLERGFDSRFEHFHNFHGCISNVRVRNPVGEAVPLKEYSENDRHLRNKGLPGLDSCAGFPAMASPGIVLEYRDTLNISAVMGSEWAFLPAQRAHFTAVAAPSSHPERDTPMDDVVPAVCGAIFLVVAVILVGFGCKLYMKKTKEERKKKEELKKEKKFKPFDNDNTDKRSNYLNVNEATKSEMVPLMSVPNGVKQAGNEEVRTTETSQGQAPKDPVEDVQVRQSGEASEGVDRPLSWDKSADNLPLTIGGQGDGETDRKEVDSSSESSLEVTAEFTQSGTSSHRPSLQDGPSAAESSPSSTRVQRGSNTMLYIDEDADAETEPGSDPKLIRYERLPGTDFSEDGVRGDADAQTRSPEEDEKKTSIKEGEVQKIVKSDDENEYVIVDDEQETSERSVQDSLSKPDEEDVDLGKGEAEPKKKEQVQEEEKAEEHKPKQAEAVTEAEIHAESIPKLGEKEPQDSKAEDKSESAIHSEPQEEKGIAPEMTKPNGDRKVIQQLPPPPPVPAELESKGTEDDFADAPDMPPPPPPPETESGETKDTGTDASPKSPVAELDSSTSSDEEFVELRTEKENVQDARRMTSQHN